MSDISGWIESHQHLLALLGAISAFTFVASLVALPWLVALIPEDYFIPRERQPADWKQQHPAIRLLALISKNLLGYILLAGGILMLFLPGQGLLTIAMGLLLIDYPGKFAVERRIASNAKVLSGLNWLRGKAGKPPLQVTDPATADQDNN